MKYLILTILSMFLSVHSFSCDILPPRIELSKVEKRVKYVTVGNTIANLETRSVIIIKDGPDWLRVHKPSKSGSSYFYSLEIVKKEPPLKFRLNIREGGRDIILEVNLNVTDPSPNRNLSEFEKACGRIPYSSITYN